MFVDCSWDQVSNKAARKKFSIVLLFTCTLSIFVQHLLSQPPIVPLKVSMNLLENSFENAFLA